MTRSKLAIIGALTAAALATSAVYAGENSSDDEIDAATLAKANVALDQAITVAEQHTQGKAVQAEFEEENGKLVYEVEVMKGATAMDVKVDATTGAVLSAKADKPDDHAKNGKDDEEDND
jgi:uncharacterized membrane protein YkoI